MKQNNDNSHCYDDIIHLPHHVSAVHPHMSAADRAAQFSPFAALTGYDAALKETGRMTEERMELDEDAKEILDEKLRMIQKRIEEHPKAAITYFEPDKRKEGGSYITVTGHIKKIDECKKTVIMRDGMEIPVEEIAEIKIKDL